jgi:saccharopine dehydrogenase (NADP+, L-glutamate forming)
VFADKLFDQPASLSLERLGTLEGYPNRDSMSYLETYGLDGAKTILRGSLRSRFLGREDKEVLGRLERLGLTSDRPIPLGSKNGLQAMAALMSERFCYGPSERDMIVLRHEIGATYPDGSKEKFTSTLLDFGQPGGDSAMARTVGLPAAICARLILEDRIKERGALIPILPSIYTPILKELQSFDISFKEKRKPVAGHVGGFH